MKPTRVLCSFFLACLCGAIAVGQSTAPKRSAAPRGAGSSAQPPAPPVASPPDVVPGAKVVQYGDKDVVRLKTKLRYTTRMCCFPIRRLQGTLGDRQLGASDQASVDGDVRNPSRRQSVLQVRIARDFDPANENGRPHAPTSQHARSAARSQLV